MPNPTNGPNHSDQHSTDPHGKPRDGAAETPISSLPTQPATVEPVTEMPGFIGPYRVVAFLGRGGQGSVFRAAHPTLARDVVIKLAARELTPAQQESLFAEGRVLARLDDPGLIRVYDANLHAGRPYVVFEFVQGRTLADHFRGSELRSREAVALVARLADILERVHRAGVLHRDLKPTNVLIDSVGNPRLMDFGSALLRAPYTDAVGEEELSGTPSYMPPEQANGATDRVGPASDVFGLAAILYHLLTGSPPYPGPNTRVVWDLARTGQVRPAKERNPAIPPALAAVLDRALSADPAHRHQSAAEFARALRGYLRRPLWRVAALVAGIAVVAVSPFAIAQLRKDRDQPPPGRGPLARDIAPRPRLAGWREYEIDGAYAATFPANPKMTDEKIEGKRLPVRRAQAIAANGTGYAVTVSPHRDPAPTPQAALRARRDEVFKYVNASLTAEREISLGGYHGADASAFVPSGPFQGHWVRLRVYLVGDKFYTLAVMGRDPHRPEDPEAAWFFDSFRLLEPDKR